MTVITLDNWVAADRRVFSQKKKRINAALHGDTGLVDGVTEENKEKVFYMLLFCLAVPQGKADKAEEAIEVLRKADYFGVDLSTAVVHEACLGRTRFPSIKADRIISAKTKFEQIWKILQDQYAGYLKSTNGTEECKLAALECIRNVLIKHIDGVGMKLSSHLMRNVGMPGLAILDVHVLKCLYKRGLIETSKPTLDRAAYQKIEKIMREYAEDVGITVEQLDFLMWSEQTGYVFK